jgi:hypothetical protein
MYTKNANNNFYNFRSSVKYATIKFAIMIENGQSLKFCQMRQVLLLSCLTLDQHQLEAFGPPPDPHMGLREGIGAMREEWEGGKEEIER